MIGFRIMPNLADESQPLLAAGRRPAYIPCDSHETPSLQVGAAPRVHPEAGGPKR